MLSFNNIIYKKIIYLKCFISHKIIKLCYLKQIENKIEQFKLIEMNRNNYWNISGNFPNISPTKNKKKRKKILNEKKNKKRNVEKRKEKNFLKKKKNDF